MASPLETDYHLVKRPLPVLGHVRTVHNYYKPLVQVRNKLLYGDSIMVWGLRHVDDLSGVE